MEDGTCPLGASPLAQSPPQGPNTSDACTNRLTLGLKLLSQLLDLQFHLGTVEGGSGELKGRPARASPVLTRAHLLQLCFHLLFLMKVLRSWLLLA